MKCAESSRLFASSARGTTSRRDIIAWLLSCCTLLTHQWPQAVGFVLDGSESLAAHVSSVLDVPSSLSGSTSSSLTRFELGPLVLCCGGRCGQSPA